MDFNDDGFNFNTQSNRNTVNDINENYGNKINNNQNSSIIELSEENFDSLIQDNVPLLVDFWATWCGPCKFMVPVVDKLSEKYAGKVKFARLNVDDHQSIAEKYDVYAIPTFIVFVNGQILERAAGAVGETGLQKILEKYR